MKKIGNELIFDSGKALDVCVGYSGLSLDDEDQICGGYDEILCENGAGMFDGGVPLSNAECAEVAAYMVNEWTAWALRMSQRAPK